MRPAALIIAATLAAACSPPDTAAPPPSISGSPSSGEAGVPFEPTAEMIAAFPNCTWEEVRAAGLEIRSFACPNARLVGDEALPGFQLVTTEPNGVETRTIVVRVFAKPADAPIDAVLEVVRAASPGWATATCVFAPADETNVGAQAVESYQLMPTGAAFAAWEAYLNLENPGAARPCGPMGPTEPPSSRTFEILDGAPDKVVFVDRGMQSGQVYYPETLRAVE